MLFGLIASVGLALASPLGGGFGADQRARADLHGERPPPFTLHFEKLIFGNTVEAAEFADRHCERVQVRAHRPPPVLRRISLLCCLFAGNFWTRRHRRHSAQTRWRTIRLNEIFPEGRCGEMWGTSRRASNATASRYRLCRADSRARPRKSALAPVRLAVARVLP